jgi:hypothetical protein
VRHAWLRSTCDVGMPRAITPQHLHKNEQSGLSFTVTHNSARWRGHRDSVGVLQTAHLHLFRSVASFLPRHAIMCIELNAFMWRVATNCCISSRRQPTEDEPHQLRGLLALKNTGLRILRRSLERPQVERRIVFASRLPSSV